MDGTEKRRVPQQNPTLSGNSATLVLADPVEAGTLEVADGVDDSFTPPTAPVTAQDDGTALDATTTTQQGATSFCLFCKLANCVARSFLFDNPLAADA